MTKHLITFLLFMSTTIGMAQTAHESVVVLQTTYGDISIRLYDDTPGHRDNFIQNVNDGMYDGVLFHRIIRRFMIQTGNPDTRPGVTEKVEPEDTTQMGPSIPAEIRFPDHYHLQGVVAAARESDDINPEKESSKYQFYIVTGRTFDEARMRELENHHKETLVEEAYKEKVAAHQKEISEFYAKRNPQGAVRYMEKLQEQAETEVADNYQPFFSDEQIRSYRYVGGTPWLDGDYTVFGEVIDGMDVVRQIEKTKTDKQDAPLEDIRIIKAYVKE